MCLILKPFQNKKKRKYKSKERLWGKNSWKFSGWWLKKDTSKEKIERYKTNWQIQWKVLMGMNQMILRNVSPPLDARRLGFVLEAEILRWTPRCVGLCTEVFAAALPSLAMLRNERDEPDLEPSDSGCRLNCHVNSCPFVSPKGYQFFHKKL